MLYRRDSTEVSVHYFTKYDFHNCFNNRFPDMTQDELLRRILKPGPPKFTSFFNDEMMKVLLNQLSKFGVEFEGTTVEERLKELQKRKYFSMMSGRECNFDLRVNGFLTKDGNYYIAPCSRHCYNDSITDHGIRQVNTPGNPVSKIVCRFYLTVSGKVHPIPDDDLRKPVSEFTPSSPLPNLPPIKNIRHCYDGWYFLTDFEGCLYCFRVTSNDDRESNRYLESQTMISDNGEIQIYQLEFTNVLKADHPEYNILTMLLRDGTFECYEISDNPHLMATISNIREMKRIHNFEYLLTTTDGRVIRALIGQDFHVIGKGVSCSFTDLPWEGFWTLRQSINPRVKSARR